MKEVLKKIITKSILNKNFEYVKSVVNKLPGGKKELAENVFIKLGLRVEILKEKEIIDSKNTSEREKKQKYQIFYSTTKTDKKLEVNDFTGNLRARFLELQKFLMQRPNLQNLISINKISSERQNLSIIGIVSEKRITKNKNLIIIIMV